MARADDQREDGSGGDHADPALAIRIIVRQSVELLVALSLGIIVFRTFVAEAYIVPTGSMAPTLLGMHREVPCTNCGYRFVVGMDERGRSGRPVCPNCGMADLATDDGISSNGDRLLVHKSYYDFRAPRRWEVAVFQSPTEPSQAYVKRVVGLPGEAVQVRSGDIAIDGRLVRKGLAEFRAMRQVVFDNEFIPADSNRFPRFVFRRGGPRGPRPSDWTAVGTGFRHEASDRDGKVVDWLDYKHWDPDTGRYGPVRDFTPYNGGDLRGDNVIGDLMVEARVSVRPDCRGVVFRVNAGADTALITLPIDGRGLPEVRHNGVAQPIDGLRSGLVSSPADAPRGQRVEVGVIDRRVHVAIDGVPAFDAIDFEGTRIGPSPFATPISIGTEAGTIDLAHLKVFRDVYYTTALANTPRRPFAVDTPYVLGPDEYFVLGDNSPVSNDSRFWPGSPVVHRRNFVGKPFLVHLPGQLASLRVFGRSICWIPDPREIRYIR